ncbi:MAG: tetratricopeptide repeat protein, partial [Kovacikia sp.]
MRSPPSLLTIPTVLLLTIGNVSVFSQIFRSDSTLAQTRTNTAESFFQQGSRQYQIGQLKDAITSWQRARVLYQQAQNVPGEGTALTNLGTAYLMLERYQDAVGTLEAYLALAKLLNDRRGEAQALSNLGIAHEALGNYGKALECHRQAGRLMRATGDRQGLGQALVNLGNTFEAVGDDSNAQIAYEQSLLIAREVGDRPGESIALGNLGAIEANLGRYNQAIAAHQQSLIIARTIGNRSSQASALINLGSAYHSLSMGKTERNENRKKALGFYQQGLVAAQQSGDRKRQSEALSSLGLLYEDLGKYPQAIDYHQQSLQLARSLDRPDAIGTALNNLGHALLGAGKLAEAEAQLRAAVKLLDALRPGLSDTYKVSIFDTQIHTYNLLQQILIAANKPIAALEASEQGRARAFAELLAKNLRDRGRREEPRDKEQESASPIPTPNPRLPPLKAMDIGTIRKIAQQQQATLVEYAIVPDDDFKFRGNQRARESELFIWVVSPTGKVAFRRVDLKPLWQKGATLTEIVRVSRCLVPGDDCGAVA